MTNIRDRIQEELVKPSPDDVDGMWTLIDELAGKGWVYEDGSIKVTTEEYGYESSILAYCVLSWMGYYIGYRDTEWCMREEIEEELGTEPWQTRAVEESDNKFRFLYQEAEQALEKLEKDDD